MGSVLRTARLYAASSLGTKPRSLASLAHQYEHLIMAWKPDAQHKQLAASLLVSNAALRSALKEIYHLKGVDGAQWLGNFEQQLLFDPGGLIERANEEVGEVKDAIRFMVQALFEAVRSDIAKEGLDLSPLAASASSRRKH